MGQIHVLEDAVINKIAAGEVVERPSSVIKELVENSLDAGATEITVDIDQGGCSRITVRDNGCGIAAEDMPRAVLRHATSKIKNSDDLVAIATMGFRGEALASVASVSKLTLQTRQAGAKHGSVMKVEGGTEATLEPWNGAEGTELTVTDLFYNVPARLRFLKSPAAEFAATHELVQGLALANPAVSMNLIHNGKVILDVPSISDTNLSDVERLRRRAAAIFPSLPIDQLIPIQREDAYGHVTGLISPPGLEKGSAKWQFTFVNGRLIKDRVLRSAIIRGYHSHLLKGRYPIVLINVFMDPSLVDVNVHPAKTEVRFQYGSDLQGVVAMAIREQLRTGEWETKTPESHSSSDDWEQKQSEEQVNIHSSNVVSSEFTPRHFQSGVKPSTKMSVQPTYTSPPRSWRETQFEASTTMPQTQQSKLFADLPGSANDFGVPWRDLQFIGDFGKCFLLFSEGERLLAVDQHAFHERILYERLMSDKKLLDQSQRLLMPESVTLSPKEIATLQESQEDLRRIGFHLTFPSDDTVDVLGVPALLMRADIAGLIEQIAGDLQECPSIAEDQTHLHHLLSTMACHGAVRAGEELSHDDLRALIVEAHDVDFVHNCPHGRRVFRWFSKQQVASWFDR